QLRALDSLVRFRGDSRHLSLLLGERTVELAHAITAFCGLFLVSTVHRLAKGTQGVGALGRQLGELAPKPEELEPRGRVRADGLDGEPGTVADLFERTRRELRNGRLRQPAGGGDEQRRERRGGGEQKPPGDEMAFDEDDDGESQ